METGDLEGFLDELDLEDEEIGMVHLWDVKDQEVKLDIARYYILDEDSDIVGLAKDHARGFWDEAVAINIAASIANSERPRKVRVARPSTSSSTTGRRVEWATRWNVGDKIPELKLNEPNHKQYGDFGSW